jgi:type I restriction enzyme S subunit
MSNSRYQTYFAVEGGWFNELPAHWQKLPSTRVFEQRRESAKEDDEQLSATQKYGVVPQSLFMALDDRKVTLALAGTDNFKHVDEGNFVISLRSFAGGIELSNYSGCVSPAYTCLKARKPIANDYYKFALKCSDYILALQSVTQGIRDGKNISYGEFSRLSVPYPPLLEQLAIATFLDRETAKIDALIAEQQRLIELLQEKRQAVISHAVTKGLNPDAPKKDSGVEWLGEVPEHWEVLPAGRVCEIFAPQRDKPDLNAIEDGYPWITLENIKNGNLVNPSAWVSIDAARVAGVRPLAGGSVIASCIGNFGIAAVTKEDSAINQRICSGGGTAHLELQPC